MSIIKIPVQIVKSFFGSGLSWVLILVFVLVLWLSKWRASKAWEILKLLAELVVKAISLVLGVFGIQVKKAFDEVGL